jgi:hypothetical protein
MKDTISLIETDLIDDKIQKILRQTSYTQEKAREKLQEYNYDEIQVIKSYFGISEKKEGVIKSVNQEIYKQLRSKLNSNMRDYQERVDRGEVKKIV